MHASLTIALKKLISHTLCGTWTNAWQTLESLDQLLNEWTCHEVFLERHLEAGRQLHACSHLGHVVLISLLDFA